MNESGYCLAMPDLFSVVPPPLFPVSFVAVPKPEYRQVQISSGRCEAKALEGACRLETAGEKVQAGSWSFGAHINDMAARALR